jgi:hypothetical protein
MAALVAQLGESNALHEGEFAAMMEVVGDDVPGNPLTYEPGVRMTTGISRVVPFW